MNKTPSILVDTGFEVDQNGVLTEIDVPNVVTTLNAPTKITFNGTSLNYIPSTAAALQQLICPNCTSVPKNLISGYNALTTLDLRGLKNIGYDGSGATFIANCNLLSSINLDAVESISFSGSSTPKFMYNLPSVATLNLPLLQTLTAGGNAFASMGALHTVSIPKLQTTSGTIFYAITSLLDVTLGSEGSPVTSLGSNTFNGCTQSGLTITVYTADGNAISGSPWGATNATIVWEEA